MKHLIGLVVLFASVNSFADSRYLDSKRMSSCGGTVELRQADNGDLALKFEGLNNRRCDSLRFYDVTSGRTLKSYRIEGTSYTLSQSHRESLSDDCRVGFTVSGQGGWIHDDFNVVLNWCVSRRPIPTPIPSGRQSFELSNNGNCKLMINGQYSNRNVSDMYCEGARRGDVVSYEFSRNGNCKRMINGTYSNVNVADRLCTARL